MRCPQPVDRRPAADLAGRPSRTAADGPGEEPKSSAPPCNSSSQRQVGTCAGSLVSTKSISTGRSEADRRGAGSGLRRERARAGWPVPADGPRACSTEMIGSRPRAPAFGSSGSAAGLPEPPFLRLPFGRDIDRQARIDQRGARIAPPSAAQEAKRAPPPRLESSLRLPLAARRTAGKPAAGQLGPVPPPSGPRCRIVEKPLEERRPPSGARCCFSTEGRARIPSTEATGMDDLREFEAPVDPRLHSLAMHEDGSGSKTAGSRPQQERVTSRPRPHGSHPRDRAPSSWAPGLALQRPKPNRL
jgi:hypothetical protein